MILANVTGWERPLCSVCHKPGSTRREFIGYYTTSMDVVVEMYANLRRTESGILICYNDACADAVATKERDRLLWRWLVNVLDIPRVVEHEANRLKWATADALLGWMVPDDPPCCDCDCHYRDDY